MRWTVLFSSSRTSARLARALSALIRRPFHAPLTYQTFASGAGVHPDRRDFRHHEDDRDTNNGRCKYVRDCRHGDGPDHTGNG